MMHTATDWALCPRLHHLCSWEIKGQSRPLVFGFLVTIRGSNKDIPYSQLMTPLGFLDGYTVPPDCWVQLLGWGRSLPDSGSRQFGSGDTNKQKIVTLPLGLFSTGEMVGRGSGENFKRGQHLLGFSSHAKIVITANSHPGCYKCVISASEETCSQSPCFLILLMQRGKSRHGLAPHPQVAGGLESFKIKLQTFNSKESSPKSGS